MKINRGPQSGTGIVDIELSSEMIELLENFNCVWLSNGDKYYKIPYWFKTTDKSNVFKVLDEQDLISNIGTLTRLLDNKRNEEANNFK